MQVNVYRESTSKGKTLLHLLDYPGCIVKGTDANEAWSRLPGGFTSYLLWCERHGFTAAAEPFEYLLREEQSGGPFNPGDKAALFSPDRQLLEDSDREELFKLMAASREDLLLILAGMPAQAFELWLDTPKWPVHEILRHIASAERFYITRLFEPGSIPRSRVSKDIFDRLNYMRETCLTVLHNLTEEERGKAVTVGAEDWTARKVFRRFIEHEREHTGQILRILHHHSNELNLRFDLQETSKSFRGISWKECYE